MDWASRWMERIYEWSNSIVDLSHREKESQERWLTMDYEACFPTRFLKAADLQGKDVTIRIGGIKLEKMPDSKTRGIIMFDGTEKEFLLNRTNAEACAVMFGRETNDWIHKRLTLCTRQVDAFGESVPAVRIKGSPDIDKPMSKVITRGNGQRQKTIKVEVVPTGAKGEK